MKNILILFIAVLAGGCYCVHQPTDPCAKPLQITSGFMVVNNSGAIINLIQDGNVIAEKIEPGQVVPIRPVWMRTSAVVAVGYTPAGEYVGSDSYLFASNVRETWTVTRLIRPQTSVFP